MTGALLLAAGRVGLRPFGRQPGPADAPLEDA
jgi:hypothetical protein